MRKIQYCSSGHLLALPAAAGTAAASAASSAAAPVFTKAFAVAAAMAAAEAAAEAADAAAVPAAAGKGSKCPEKQQTKKSQPQRCLGLAQVLCAVDLLRLGRVQLVFESEVLLALAPWLGQPPRSRKPTPTTDLNSRAKIK